MKKPMVIEEYCDNGELSHYALINPETGVKIWSEDPNECRTMGYPVSQKIECPQCGLIIQDQDNPNDIQN